MVATESFTMYHITILDNTKVEHIKRDLNRSGVVFNNIENYGIMVNMQDSDFSYKEKAIKAIEKHMSKNQAKMVLDEIPELLIIR
jgi:hypothetical protein